MRAGPRQDPDDQTIEDLIAALVERLRLSGLVEEVTKFGDAPACRIPASVLIWRVAHGETGLKRTRSRCRGCRPLAAA